jgi:hypothetical protein
MWQGAEFVLPHINKKTANSFGCFYKNAYLCSRIVLWCNGSTTGFGSVCGGSNPPRTTFKETLLGSPFLFILLQDSLRNPDKGKIVVVRIRLRQLKRRLKCLLFSLCNATTSLALCLCERRRQTPLSRCICREAVRAEHLQPTSRSSPQPCFLRGCTPSDELSLL